jgi:hypothetical protein
MTTFFEDSLREKFFRKSSPQTIMELRTLFIQACKQINEDMCRRVMNNITVRVEEVVILNT